MALQSEIMDYLKLSAYAFVPALIAALVLGMIASAFASMAFVTYFLLAVLAIWAVAKVPKEIESFWGIIILVLFLMGIQGILGMFVPSVGMLQWASIGSVNSLLVTIVSAALGTALVKKYV